MAAPLEDPTHEEQIALTRFLAAEGLKPSEVYVRMSAQYGSSSLNQKRCRNGLRDLKKGVQVSKMSPDKEGLQR